MVDPVDLKHIIDQKLGIDRKMQRAREKPPSDGQTFARELDNQSELSESQVQGLSATDEVKITEHEHQENRKNRKREKKKPEEDQELEVPEETLSGKNVDETSNGSAASGESEKHNVDIKI